MYGSARTITNLEGSPSRSPRLPRSPRLGHRRTSSGGGGGTGKTLSMENIQSLNAAYATSGPMYLSDHEGVASTTYPKGTMTLGRATNRAVYGGRVTAMGSSPNIASAGLSHTDVLSYTDQHGGLTSSSHHHHHQVPSMLRQVRDSTMLDLQAQLKELQRENDLLRKELDIKDSKLGSSMNSIKTFWSPELKKERVLRKEEAARMSVLKEQMRVSHEENQVNANGSVLLSEIVGTIKLKVFLSGMPELRLGLNDRVLFELTGRSKNKSVELEDVKFHQCVRLSCFDNDRTISFIPPDGDFELMSYRLSTQVKPLIWIESIIEKFSHSHLEIMVKAKGQFKKQLVANGVEISVPVPSDADSPRFKTSVGSAKYVPEKNMVIWSIRSFPGGKEYLMRAHFGLPSVEKEEVEGQPPTGVKFEIPYFTVSRIQHLQLTIQALQDELRTQRDLNHLLQQESGNRGAEHFTIELTEENFRRLQAEHDRQAKELFLLRKTLEEMELRIETQKQTLNARDESIKKLLEMLQSKGLPSKSLEDDNERTRRMAEAESQVSHLEVILDQKEKENIHLREELHQESF
nr:ERC protein 2-like [Odocoileus virginianus texanus]